jgi:hypothetical protein
MSFFCIKKGKQAEVNAKDKFGVLLYKKRETGRG